ncbi:MAG TPA: GTP 3',8-cyclase MoaA [Elusimicrobia bacterium]|nr:MAG: cyclic pyranopterin phosphate synthase MoaA [Elusimicrobia bacterium GWD2_63_28]HCC48113.1 GTP 3',8-cyclase MoaA [Elusimicrobiota bacterium]
MEVEYLRLSLTDRCNLNCIYCTPREKSGYLGHDDLLRHEELARAAGAFVRAGVKKIRLTGGEPLVRKNIVGLVKLLRAIPGLQELALTTNGLLLKDLAVPLREAGLNRVNISLDTLNPATFKLITGSEGLDAAWDGLMASLKAGFSEVKLNVVVMKNINDSEVAEFARLSIDFPLTVRFIEFFPTNERSANLKGALFTTAETKKRIEEVYGPLEELPPAPAGGPARIYRRRGAKGKIGFISGRSGYFCGSCNRVRMDCTGKVYPCLFSPATHDLKELLRGGAPDEVLADYLKKIFLVKSKYRKDSPTAGHIEMSSLGG